MKNFVGCRNCRYFVKVWFVVCALAVYRVVVFSKCLLRYTYHTRRRAQKRNALARSVSYKRLMRGLVHSTNPCQEDLPCDLVHVFKFFIFCT